MGTKNNPGTYDCYANAHPDEPMFILLGRDPYAPDLVEAWADRREAERGPSTKVDEARACAEAMRRWQATTPAEAIARVCDAFEAPGGRGLRASLRGLADALKKEGGE